MDWFPMYWQRFILGTRDFKTEEVGAYFLLLLEQWDKGFLPENDKELKKISGISMKKLEKVMKKFKKIDGKYFNEALEIIRIEQNEKAVKYSNRGTNAAKARWFKQCTSNAQASDKHYQNDAIREDKNKIRIREEAEASDKQLPVQPILSNLEQFKQSSETQQSMYKFCKSLGRPLAIKRILELADAHNIAFTEKFSHAAFPRWCEYFRYFLEKHRETKQPEQGSGQAYKPYNPRS